MAYCINSFSPFYFKESIKKCDPILKVLFFFNFDCSFPLAILHAHTTYSQLSETFYFGRHINYNKHVMIFLKLFLVD